MAKVNLFIANADGSLTSERKTLKSAIQSAQDYAFSRLKTDQNIDVVIREDPDEVIPEDGIGGFTFTSNFIMIYVEKKRYSGKTLIDVLCHEFCHATRWQKNPEWGDSLFDSLIFEGLATYLETEVSLSRKTDNFFAKTMLARTDAENEKILKVLRSKLNRKTYDRRGIFFDGTDTIPRWAGYSLGYYLVKKYLQKTGKTIEEAYTDKYANFKKVLL